MTAAKLRELLKAASPGPFFFESDGNEILDAGTWPVAKVYSKGNPSTKSDSEATRKLLVAAPALARLVLELSDKLERTTSALELAEDCEEVQGARVALAAVEELEL